MKAISAENFIRSANAPQMSAGVMTANVNWNIMNTDSGIEGAKRMRNARPHALQHETVQTADQGFGSARHW